MCDHRCLQTSFSQQKTQQQDLAKKKRRRRTQQCTAGMQGYYACLIIGGITLRLHIIPGRLQGGKDVLEQQHRWPHAGQVQQSQCQSDRCSGVGGRSCLIAKLRAGMHSVSLKGT